MSTVTEGIRRHQDEIVALWLEQAQRAASARGLTQPEFLNIIPEYVQSLTADDDIGACGKARRELVETHLAARLRQGFDLGEIVNEFALLGRCVAVVWSKDPPDQ